MEMVCSVSRRHVSSITHTVSEKHSSLRPQYMETHLRKGVDMLSACRLPTL